VVVSAKWVLEIYDSRRRAALISTQEFDDFASLQTTIVENLACRLLIDPSEHATPNEFQCLLDLRGQGFEVERR
jgi:hypothetical protein